MSRALLVALLLLCASGCASSSFRRAEDFDPRVPLRVAVLPFQDVAAGDPWYSVPLAAVVDLLPILSDDRLTRERAATIFREKFQGNLYRTHLDVVNLHVVDSLLGHRGLRAEALYAADRADAARKLGEALGVDAVVFGWVTEWEREYYVVESVARAGLRVELRDTVSGEVLFAGEARDAETSGVTKLPIDYSPDGAAQSILLEAIKGLRNTLFIVLSDDVARQIVTGLAPPAAERAEARAPVLRFVAHSARAPLAAGDEVVVVALGDPDCRPTFRAGRGAWHPMTETAPGSYQGVLRISSAHDLRDAPLTVRLVSRSLKASTMTVARPPLRTAVAR